MNKATWVCSRSRNISAFMILVMAVFLLAGAAQAQVSLVQLSSDPFTDTDAQHMTEVEPDTFAFGSTEVTAFQTGRIFNGGSSDIGFATTSNAGVTWTNGFLPGITVNMGGHFSAASDPSVAFDAAHGKWMIASLGLSSNNSVLVSTSSDGLNWNNPVTVDSRSGFADKDWIACDSNSGSPFFGHCYVEWDDAGLGDQEKMSTSTDGGQTWSAAVNVRNAFGLGGQPVVQPNGTVVVPFEGNGIQAFSSTDGGMTWGNLVTVSSISDHLVAGSMRTSPLPSAEVDGAGTVYVAWQDCRFRTGCRSNDIVFSSSSDGRTWSQASRVPSDPTTSSIDHFIPGLAVDPNTSGSTAHLAVTFYFFPVANCGSNCKLTVGFISSQDAGKTWSRPIKLAGPMRTSWLANTNQGRMVGDYMSTSYVNGGVSFGVFARGLQNSGSVFNEAMYTTNMGLDLTVLAGPGVLSSAGDKPVPNAHSDHGPSLYWDHEGRLPKNPATPPAADLD
jgi:hypothetical protein